jgi:uncharacterized protein (TIGR02001 family)
MKKIASVFLAASLMAGSFAAQAQEAGISGSVGVATDYVFRGLSFNDRSPSVQAAVKYQRDDGFYIGMTAAEIDFADDIFADVRGGYRGVISPELSYDVGFTALTFIGESSLNTTEWRAGLNFNSLSVAAARSHDMFGSDGKSWYYSANYNFALADNVELDLFAGYSWFDLVRFGGKDNYTNYGASLNIGVANGIGFNFSLTDTNLSRSQCDGSRNCSRNAVIGVFLNF